MIDWLRRIWRSDPHPGAEHLALDLETTGLDPRRDRILAAGMVPIRDGAIHWGERRYRLVRPDDGGVGDDDAVAVHGLLPDEVAAAEPVGALVEVLRHLLADRVLVVHWGALDVALLRRVFREHDVPWPDPVVADTAELMTRLDRRRGLVEPFAGPTPTQLAAARRALGLPPHEEHHALYDALATAELYLLLRSRLP